MAKCEQPTTAEVIDALVEVIAAIKLAQDGLAEMQRTVVEMGHAAMDLAMRLKEASRDG